MAELEGVPSDFTFCPTHDDCFLAFMSMLPPGTAWDNVERPDPTNKTSVIQKFMSGLALGWLGFEDAMCESLDEWICATADVDQDAWARDYGIPDECEIYAGDPCAKVSAYGPPTANYLIGLLASNGYTAEGRWLAGDDPEFPGTRATFRAIVDPSISPAFKLTTILNFALGTGHRLGAIQLGGLQCMLERYIPAHCAVDVSVAGSFNPTVDLATKLKLWWNADTTANGAVTTWTDQVNTIPPTQATAGSRPVSAITSGFRWLTFDGVDDFLRTTSTYNPSGPINNLQLFALFEPADQLGDPHILITLRDGTQARRIATRLSTAQQQLAVAANATDELVDTNLSSSASGVSVGMGNFQPGSPSTIGGRINARQTTPPSVVATLSPENNLTITIGASGDTVPVGFFRGRVRHLMAVVDATPHDVARLEAWLAWDVLRNDVLDGASPYRNLRP